jgi:hypothetical protein
MPAYPDITTGGFQVSFSDVLKDIEYRFNPRRGNRFKRFLQVYFGYVSPLITLENAPKEVLIN